MQFDSSALRDGFMWAFRPASYFAPKPDLQNLLATVKGTVRRGYIERLADEGRLNEVPRKTRKESLDERSRKAIGRVHPSLMGGEYLPDRRAGEIEIARVELASVTGDVMSVRARPLGERIAYRVVGENDSEYTCRPRSSRQPLSLEELVRMMDGCCERGGLVISNLELNAIMGGTHPDELRLFVSVRSAFYSELGDWYALVADAWLDACKAEFHPGEEGA